MFKRLSNTDKSNLFLIFVIGAIQDYLTNPRPDFFGGGLGTLFLSMGLAIIFYFIISKMGFFNATQSKEDHPTILDDADYQKEEKSPRRKKDERNSRIIKIGVGIAIILSLLSIFGIYG